MISPTIVCLDDDSDPFIESDLLVNSDIFEYEPEKKSNFTKVLQEISKPRKCEQNHDNNIRTHETALSVEGNAHSINNIKKNKVMKITNQRETV